MFRVKRRHFIIVGVVIMLLVSGCGSSSSIELQEGKVNVVTTFYPLYDFAQSIGGDHVHVINLVPAGVDPHDWSPKSQDMKIMSEAELFVFNGAGFESWLGDFFSSVEKQTLIHRVEASLGVDLIQTRGTNGLDDEHDDKVEHEGSGTDDHSDERLEQEETDHENEQEESDHGHDHGDVDPHIWLSPLQAKIMAANVKDGLIQVDPVHQADYELGYERLAEKLDELHQRYVKTLSSSPRKEFVVSHQSLGYLARDYGLSQIAVMGLSPDSEPTAQDMLQISKFIREHKVQYILFEELVSPKIAETLARDLQIETLIFNPVEGLTEEQIKAGDNYISIMTRNLTSLEKALQ